MYKYLNVYKQMTDVKLLLLHSNTWDHLTACKRMSLDLLPTKCVYKSYSMYIYKADLALNNLQ